MIPSTSYRGYHLSLD